jgi:hypothetical protein
MAVQPFPRNPQGRTLFTKEKTEPKENTENTGRKNYFQPPSAKS